jgi:hypothetical protein
MYFRFGPGLRIKRPLAGVVLRTGPQIQGFVTPQKPVRGSTASTAITGFDLVRHQSNINVGVNNDLPPSSRSRQQHRETFAPLSVQYRLQNTLIANRYLRCKTAQFVVGSATASKRSLSMARARRRLDLTKIRQQRASANALTASA